MPAAVKIKPGQYGRAIALLLEHGGAFQTRRERTLTVNSAQQKILEGAGLIDNDGLEPGSIWANRLARRGDGG